MKGSLKDVRDRDEALRWVVDWLRHYPQRAVFIGGRSKWRKQDHTSSQVAVELERLLDRTRVPWEP